mgnify:CR=1 FL=1
MPTYPDTLALREDCRIGDTRTISLRTYHSTTTVANSQIAPASGWFLGLDPSRSTVLTATSGGVARFKAAVSGATNLWNSCPAEVTQGSITYQTECRAYTAGATTGLWTIYPLAVAIASNASVKFPGYPVLPRTSATLSGAKGSIIARPSGANTYTAEAGERRLIYAPTFTGGDQLRQVGVHSVRPAW